MHCMLLLLLFAVGFAVGPLGALAATAVIGN
jgi:hypothetical protein